MSAGARRIRDAVVEGLKLERTAAGERVYGNRTRPVWKDTLPVLLVFTREERAELFQVSPKVYRRTLEVVVDLVAEDQGQSDDAVDDRLDALAEEVERFFFRDSRLGLGAFGPEFELEDTRLESVQLVAFDRELHGAERPIAGQRITWSVRYLQEAIEGRSEQIEPFHGGNIDWRLKPGDELSDARDTVTLPGA
jgi:hypothetical protein